MLKARRGNGYHFVPKGGTFPTETIMLVVRSSGLWEAYTQTCPKWDKKFNHGMLMPLHDSMPSFMNFRRVLDLLELKNHASQCFAGNQRCPGVRNSFPFLAWDLSMHPRTQIWFFNQFICIGACACSSNLNYAHKCIETQLMHKNVQMNPEKSQKLTKHSCCSMLTREKIWKQ